jgi:hypothetical protein
VALHRCKRAQDGSDATGSTAAATANSTLLYRIAITQARVHQPARAYHEGKRADGKSRREAIRCLKRLLVRVVYQTLKASPALT